MSASSSHTSTQADDVSMPTLPTSSPAQTMQYDDPQSKPEARPGDGPARQMALIAASVIVTVTWSMVIFNSPGELGWFALHPPLQTLSLLAFTYGIITLQPTNKPKTKAAGLLRHQVAIFLVGCPCFLLGTFAVWYNKWLRGADHFVSWHGTFGIICAFWFVFQVVLGAGSVWFNGALFGGGLKAKNLWKYHRVSGYLLFPLLVSSIYLGGAWSNWSTKYSIWIIRFITFTIAPLLIIAGVYSRIRTFKMPIFK